MRFTVKFKKYKLWNWAELGWNARGLGWKPGLEYYLSLRDELPSNMPEPQFAHILNKNNIYLIEQLLGQKELSPAQGLA